jgi:tetratricopeptide (TPR) repeat protein
MKTCANCGRASPEAAGMCVTCGSTKFVSSAERIPPFVTKLTEAERVLWEQAESAQAPNSVSMKSESEVAALGARAELLSVLALQNASKHALALKRLDDVAKDGTNALARWARAESVYAERKRTVLIDPPEGLDPEPIDPGEPLAELIEARIRLALGLVATRASRYEEARQYLDEALAKMTAIGSRAGVAVATADLAQLLVWRGDIAAAGELVHKAIALWGAAGAPHAAGEVWHTYGYLLLNTGQPAEAIAAFTRAINLMEGKGDSARSANGLAAALLADGQYASARQVAQGVLDRIEHRAVAPEITLPPGSSAPSRKQQDDAYRSIIALRTLGEIELRQDAGDRTMEQRTRAAEERLEKAVRLLGESCSRTDPICPRWIGQLTVDAARKEGGGDAKQFEKLEVLKLELLIQCERRPGEAGRHLDRVAEVFALRGEYLEELKTRREAAAAFEAAGDVAAAAAQIARARRIVTARDAHSLALANALDLRLAKLSTAATASPPALGNERVSDFAVLSIERIGGRHVRRHSFRVHGIEQVRLVEAALPHLRDLAGRVRVLRGLPAVLPPLDPPRYEGGKLTFDIVTEYAEGTTLEEAMGARVRTADEVSRAVRIFRTLAGAVDALNCMGLTDVRPNPALICLVAPDEPVLLDILPLHASPRPKRTDVALMARQLANWLAGSKSLWKHPADIYFDHSFPYVRTRASIFPGHLRDVMPPELDQFLSEAATDPACTTGWRPSTLADRLQEFS